MPAVRGHLPMAELLGGQGESEVGNRGVGNRHFEFPQATLLCLYCTGESGKGVNTGQ